MMESARRLGAIEILRRQRPWDISSDLEINELFDREELQHAVDKWENSDN